MKIGANPSLCRMDVTKIVRSVDDPELFVACRKIENLSFLWQHDERGIADFRRDGDDILL